MCGITGFISLTPRPAGEIAGMNKLLRHRGPDDEGFLLFKNMGETPIVCGGKDTPVEAYRSTIEYAPEEPIQNRLADPVRIALGHRRLSIVDLSPHGHQPMCYGDRRYWVVYNGEIYNHLELRVELENLGHRFTSQSDTEVLLASYAQWGKECLHRFNGMWAIAIYDTVGRSIFFARDRFGVKPFYYWISDAGLLAFASEIKAFTGLPGWKPRANPNRVYDFLAWGILDHTEETLFAGVFQLPPGHCATLDLNPANGTIALPGADERMSVERWYSLSGTPFNGDAAGAASGLRDLLSDSVRLRLRADVPVGSCLSGGLDSSSIVCIANGLLRGYSSNTRQETFSACATESRFDERQYIETVVEHTGVAAHYIYPAYEELFGIVDDLVWHQDEPFSSTSMFAQWSVFKLAADRRVRVMLDGQGADEQLAGYHGFLGPYLASLGRQFRFAELVDEWKAIRKLHGYGHSYLLQQAIGNLFPWLVRPVAALLGRTNARLDWLDLHRLGAEAGDPLANMGARCASVGKMSYSQLTSSNLQMLLHWEDRDSMAHSIESRVPFLDYRVVEYVLGLPDEYKIKGGMTKKVLRDAMSGILPDRIRDRIDKLGFVTPEEIWVREHGTAMFRNALVDAIEVTDGVLTPHSLKIFDQIVAGKRPFNFVIWRLICFGHWAKRFDVRVAS